ncbi:MAG: hypothetical protein LBP43_00155 [Treponema sp.]|jgi:hypothetical protein|nr:hypothetical protein [Treponema sp.]
MKKQIYPVMLVFFLWTGILSALTAAEVDLSIRYFDKRVYHASGAVADPIFVQVTIANNSPSTFRFKLAEERAFSVDFEVRTVTNRAVESAVGLVMKRTSSQQVFFREVTVESGESFSFVEDLRDYAVLTESGSFIVRAKMYPELYRESAVPALESNRLALNLRPAAIPGPEGIPLAMDVETNAVLVRERLPPDEVVEYTLRARQKGQWEKFFLYLDPEAMINRDAVRRRQWLAESEEGRRRMIARYREELQGERFDGDIAAIPMSFTVERTTYNAEEGTVIVLEKFKTGDYIERKRYTYTLRHIDDYWIIVDYSVSNLGTE